ncbi:hypothetical protein [Salmonella sp. SAL04162]|uniref:hypothetical protein n=1 Tax=Salmonella sp. SAL04162 TaxID=3159782 RepID=UPI00397DA9B0
MKLLDIPEIRELVDYALDNGYQPVFSNGDSVIIFRYITGTVIISLGMHFDIYIVKHPLFKLGNLGTEIDEHEFRRIFSRRVKGKG